MRTLKWIHYLCLVMLLSLLLGVGDPAAAGEPGPMAPTAPQARTAPLIIDHTSVNIQAVPQEWIEAAKQQLHIAYGHTSHGSQLTDGMSGLVTFANGGGLGLDLPADIFAWNDGGADGALDLDDYAMGGDVGYYPQWVENTHDYLGDPDPATGRGQAHPDVNVVMWSWCGQASDRTEQQMIDTYLAPMTALEAEYPGITFVYMTGHAEGDGETGNLHLRNQQIRDYCIANNKVLFDFYNIELYDPDGTYYGDKYVNDNCDYDPDGAEPINRSRNWATDWQGSHTEDVDWYSCSCAHSQALNCNQKAYATWWMWARLAGWNGGMSGIEGEKMASRAEATVGDVVTYTLTLNAAGTPPTGTATIQDALPDGLTYVPGSLAATSGDVDDTALPTLAWSGTLTPTPAVTVTYAVTVASAEWRSITNVAVMAAGGLEPITRTAQVLIVRPEDYPDLTPSFKTVSQPEARFGDVVTYTVGIRNATGPLDVSVLMTDTIPRGLDYVPGSLAATSGDVNDSAAPRLTWSGVLTPTPAITITYAVVVTDTNESLTIILPATHHNIATITAPGYQTITRTAVLKTDMAQIYLPLVLRQY